LCGIAGIIYRTPEHQPLGADLLRLIQPLESRGPDSCGVGLYGKPLRKYQVKLLCSAEVNVPWEGVHRWLADLAPVIAFETMGTARRVVLQGQASPDWRFESLAKLSQRFPQVHLVSMGQQLEIYKEVGSAENLFRKYGLEHFRGHYGIAHTRMATESVVDTAHSHPFTAAPDLAIVHNGQISNYYKLRFALERQGIVFKTHNDSEAIAHYLRLQLRQGQPLEVALSNLLHDFDGTYTILAATADQVGLVRDKFAAKPAVIYETSDCIAIASEFRCLINLPHFDATATREPDAGEVNVWSTVPQQLPALAGPSNSV